MSQPWDISIASSPSGPVRLAGKATGQPGGGSSVVDVATIQVSSADVLELNDTPFELLPATGGREYYVLHAVVIHYRFVTTPYTGDFFPTISYGPMIGNDDDGGAGSINYGMGQFVPDSAIGARELLAQTEDAYLIWAGFNNGASNNWTAWLASLIENQGIFMSNRDVDGDPLAAGDGTLTVRVFYSVIDGAS